MDDWTMDLLLTLGRQLIPELVKAACGRVRQRAAAGPRAQGGVMSAPITLHRPATSGGRRVSVRTAGIDRDLGIAFSDTDVEEFLRRAPRRPGMGAVAHKRAGEGRGAAEGVQYGSRPGETTSGSMDLLIGDTVPAFESRPHPRLPLLGLTGLTSPGLLVRTLGAR